MRYVFHSIEFVSMCLTFCYVSYLYILYMFEFVIADAAAVVVTVASNSTANGVMAVVSHALPFVLFSFTGFVLFLAFS